MVGVAEVGGFEVGLNGGNGGFDFVRGVSDEDFLSFVGGLDGLDGLLGEEVGEDGDDDFDGEAGDDEGEEEGGKAGFAVGDDALFHDLAEGNRVAVLIQKLDGGVDGGGFARHGGVFGDEIDGGEGGDENQRSGDEVDDDKMIAKFSKHNPILLQVCSQDHG